MVRLFRRSVVIRDTSSERARQDTAYARQANHRIETNTRPLQDKTGARGPNLSPRVLMVGASINSIHGRDPAICREWPPTDEKDRPVKVGAAKTF